MTVLVVLTVLEIVALIAALAFYLFWVGTLLARIATNLEECAEIVRGIVVVLVVVALVVPILVLARQIGDEAPKINDALTEAVHNTAPLGALRTTIEHATIIIGGLQRGRARLGG